jgi:anti-anti-sigma factor
VSDRSNAPFTCERQFVSCDRQQVVAVGEVDLATGPHLGGVLTEAQADARHVVLDLERTTFMDVSGARILLAASAHAHASAGTFAISGSTSPVRRLLKLMRADIPFDDSSFLPGEQERVTVRAPTFPLAARDRPSPLLRHPTA